MKEKLRKKLRLAREQIVEEDFKRWSEAIVAALYLQPEYREAGTIHCYVSMNDRREVNTHHLIKEMMAEGRRVVVPKTQFKEQTLRHYSLSAFEDLTLNKWGVLEPTGGEQLSEKEIDLVIVPMVGGDEKGHRIGYGGGFYDRFLSKVTCPTIGLCFEQNIVAQLPAEPFDIALDKTVTEKRIIYKDN
ncbi:MAG TPA: 5-formyltetrahydrofolate cyclo-ligase [Fodinibius sp.]|nr:5-formyltetrahydrofolate cyclo-ligase [Fodinibius sp.]